VAVEGAPIFGTGCGGGGDGARGGNTDGFTDMGTIKVVVVWEHEL